MKKPGPLFIRYFEVLSRFRAVFIFFPLLFCLLLAGGVYFLQENNDGRIFFDEKSPDRRQLVELEQNFAESNSLLLVLSSADGDIFTPQSLNAVLELTGLAWHIPYVTRVNSLSNFQHITSDEEGLIIEDMVTAEKIANAGIIAGIKKYALSEKDLIGQILSRDGMTTAIALNIAAPRGDSASIRAIMAEVEGLRDRINEKYPGLDLYVTGDIPLDNAFAEAYAYDLQYLFPFFLLVIFLTCSLFFRSFLLSGLLLAMMIMVVAATMGSSGLLGIDLTAGTSGVPIILITISLADFIHLLSSTRLGMRAGQDVKQAIQGAINRNFFPISLTSFTTIVGFLSLNFSDAPPFRDMGNLVAIGILVSYVITFTFFPAILLRLNLTEIFKRNTSRLSVPSGFISAFSEFLIKKSRMVVFVIILITISITAGLAQIEFDDDWVEYFDRDNSFRKDTEFVVDHLTGVDTIEYIATSGKEGGIADAGFLQQLDRFGDWALRQPEIIHVSSIVSIFKKMNSHMNPHMNSHMNLGNSSQTIAASSDLNAQYLLMYEMSLPVGLDLNDRIDIAKEATRLTVTARDMTSRQMRALDLRISQKLREMKLIDVSDEFEGGAGTGIPLMFANLSERNIKSMLGGIAFALLVVSLVITLFFKSLKLGLISFGVNILPIILGFGIWGWLYQYIGVSLTVVAAIAFGIVVDDSIHFITKYSKALGEKGGNKIAALKATYHGVGGALVMTTFILSLGFMILSFSLFQPTWGLGLISAMMIIIALIYDFILLPILLTFPERNMG